MERFGEVCFRHDARRFPIDGPLSWVACARSMAVGPEGWEPGRRIRPNIGWGKANHSDGGTAAGAAVKSVGRLIMRGRSRMTVDGSNARAEPVGPAQESPPCETLGKGEI